MTLSVIRENYGGLCMLVPCHPVSLNVLSQVTCEVCNIDLFLKNDCMNSWRISDLIIVLINKIQFPEECNIACVFGFL